MVNKKFFLVIGQLPPPVHGSNVMAALFLESLRKLGCRAEIIQKTFSKKVEDVGKISPIKCARVPLLALRVAQQFCREKPALGFYFLTVSLSGFLLDAMILSIFRLFKVPYIIYLHGKSLQGLARSHGFMRPVLSRTLGQARGALVLGESLRQDLFPYLDPARMVVLPNAIPDQAGDLGKTARREQAPVKILYLSNLIPTKGPLEFLHMAKIVAAQSPRVRFILAGPNLLADFYQTLLDVIKAEGLQDIVELPGGLYGKQKEQALRESDIFVFPTYYDKEAFPLVNLEAMQWGLPVISSPEGAIPEMVIDGVTGFIVNPHDIAALAERVLRLVQDPELRQQMGQAGRKRFEEQYTIAKYQQNVAKAVDFFLNLEPRTRA